MGILEEAKGRVKQAAGDLTDDDALKAEGEAQAGKGAEERKETQARASAKEHEAKADVYEKKQELAEN